MARPRGFDPGQAIDTAVELFWQRGFDQVSFDDLVAATGASRRGLYSLWNGKEELFAVAVERYGELVGDFFFAPMETPEAGLKEVAEFWDKFENPPSEPGRTCLIMRTANQPMGRRPAIAAAATRYFDRFQGAVANALANAARRGEVSSGLDAQIAARQAFGAAYAASALGNVRGYDEQVRAMIAAGRAACGVTEPG